jgi:threonine dehydratase
MHRAGKAKGDAQRKAKPTRTIQAICVCMGCGALRPHLIVEESGRLPTLSLLEAKLQEKGSGKDHRACVVPPGGDAASVQWSRHEQRQH